MEPFSEKPVLHSMPCPHCGEQTLHDDQAGGLHCHSCGREQQMGWDDPESWMEGKFNWDFNLPLEGMAGGDEMLEPGERNWVVPTRNFGPRHVGAWHFANSTGTVHYNRWTGERCNCPWNDAHAKLTKLAGSNLNKVLKAPDKALHTPEGEEFKRIMAERLGEERESLAPYLAHRFKKGDIRVGGDRDLPEGTVGGPHLQFWQHNAPFEAFRDTHVKDEIAQGTLRNELNQREQARSGYHDENEERIEAIHALLREAPERSSEILRRQEDRYFNPLADHVLANWHNWYEARQHPLRRGVNVLEGSWTPKEMDERARRHSEEVRREKQVEELSRSGTVVHKFEPQKGGVSGIDWDRVAENEDQYRTGLGRVDVEQAEREDKGDIDPELRSLREMYPKTVAPRKSGWHIKQLQDAEDLRAEGTMMGHCIGNDEKYGNCLENGLIDAYSLRDPKGRPHVTWHYNSDGSLAEMFGPNDDDIKPEYQDMLNEWGVQENKPTELSEAVGHQEEDPEEDRELGVAQFPQATDVQEYTSYHHPEQMYEHEFDDEEGRELGENTEYEWQEPEWEGVGADYGDQYKRVYHPVEGEDPQNVQQRQESIDRGFEQQQKAFFEAIKSERHQSEMSDALQNHINETYGENGEYMVPGEQPDNDHVRNVQRWNTEFPSWEVNIPKSPSTESPTFGQPHPRDMNPNLHPVQPIPSAGTVWPETPHLYDPASTWKIGPGGMGQQQIFSSSRSLYHGTLLDHLPSIQQHGLVPGIGNFTSDAYDLDPEGNYEMEGQKFTPEELNVQPLVFMADKARLQRAHNAIVHGVSRKLDKPSFQLTPQDIQEHGLLVKQPGQMGEPEHTKPPLTRHVFDENIEEGHDPWETERSPFEGHPFQAEPGDFYSDEPVGPSGLQYIHGPAMMRVFDRYKVGQPLDPLPWQLKQKRDKYERQELAKNEQNWQLVKEAMPVGEDYWNEWQERAPFKRAGELYHGTSPARLESILRHGLHPWDSPLAGGSNYGQPREDEDDWNPNPSQWLVPRPGHVYMAQNPKDARDRGVDSSVEDLGPHTEPLVLKIDPSYLDPQHINPDEDDMIPKATIRPQEGYDSLGEMADRMGYGDVPSETKRQLARGKHIGYQGVIPPEALTPGKLGPGGWTPLERTSSWHFATTMYHVAPAHAEKAIAQEGLRGDPETWENEVWLHENEDQAREYAEPEDHIYAVDTAGMENDPNHMLEPGLTPSWVAKGPIPPERIKRIVTANIIGDMRDGWGRFANAVPWTYGQWGRGIYFPETGTLQTWSDDRTHPEVVLEDENAYQGFGHHFLLRPNGTVKDQGAMDQNFENAEGDVAGLAQALHSLDPRLRLDKPSAWDFGEGPVEPMESEPSAISRGEQGGKVDDVQTSNDYAGSL